jgi:flagellar basal-body rod modification protein FlgD
MAVSGVTGASGSSGTSGTQTTQTNSSQTSGLDSLANEQTFLKLFIAQLQNQDPMNPQDGTQFVAQLAQFSDLEQTLGMHTDITAIRTNLENYLGTGSSTSSGTSGTGSATSTTDSTKG